MKKNMFFFALFIAAFAGSLASTPIAQPPAINPDKPTPCKGEKFVMPKSVSVSSDVFGNYLKIATSPAKSKKLVLT